MELTVERMTCDDDATVGALYVDGKFLCFTLEDEHRTVKVKGETRIPAGTYDIRLRAEGGMHPKYKARFGDLHQGMLWLQDVPGFEWVYIHVGNTDDHTEGCILVGEGAMAKPGKMSVQASRDAYRRLALAVMDPAAAGDLRITIKDRDHPVGRV